ncbi:hypothetical protein HG536_0B06190 [Torulaspora globosa]|uniref:AAA+ ATPase domain-containing protein n=1 Tax=Torulaspora globosa TaxID=48254 RepID=A0A7G3ZE17_9SACH|nr:uncharacterized protein HG536_0B06190 [Torulaspora globosa]QLL31753.1 hypothetical protein HG536_0B06190 [Torulaspora globosa]
MVDIDRLADEALKLLDDAKQVNYRIAIMIVGPPGSGKSTLAEKLCKTLNSRFNQYLDRDSNAEVVLTEKGNEFPDLVSDLGEISANLYNEMAENDGISKELVENVDFKPVKKSYDDGRVEVIGRGGQPNAFTIKRQAPMLRKHDVDIAQIIPMDGFHLSRKCLDCFKDPERAHQRRGSPQTFDSNNFLQLCKTLAKTCITKPPACESESCFEFISKTFQSLPAIEIPGFDHKIKDPTPNQISIDPYTRILIFEGLYLLYDAENWQNVHKVLLDTGAVLIWNVNIEEGVIRERVAKRHLNAGLVTTLEDGIRRFETNDLLNARLIRSPLINNGNIVSIRND